MLQQIDLLRHGEPVGGRMYRGKTDDPLSKKGWCEMNASVENPGDWDVVYHSPLLRCSEFSADLSVQIGIPAIEDERLQEIGFGEWEGKTADEIRQQDEKALMRFYLDPVNHQPDGAERLRDFYLRVSEVWDEII
ncbi:MAG: histidine phosphatase family protein, partial [Gammaproteobacteria bacterium]